MSKRSHSGPIRCLLEFSPQRAAASAYTIHVNAERERTKCRRLEKKRLHQIESMAKVDGDRFHRINKPDETSTRLFEEVLAELWRVSFGCLEEERSRKGLVDRLREYGAMIVVRFTRGQKRSWLVEVPWHLLLRDSEYQVRKPAWDVMLSTDKTPVKRVELGAMPKILLARGKTFEARESAAFQTVVDQLAPLVQEQSLAVDQATTWDQFERNLFAHPDVVFLFCHGSAEEGEVKFTFATADDARNRTVAPDRLVKLLEKHDVWPKVFYICACGADTGGVLGAGIQLTRRVPAVVAVLPEVEVGLAAQQAGAFLSAMFGADRLAPHAALRECDNVRTRLALDESKNDCVAQRPRLWAAYSRFQILPSASEQKAEVGRDEMTGKICVRLRARWAEREARQRSPGAVVVFGYAKKGQGLGRFSIRVGKYLSSVYRDSKIQCLDQLDWGRLCEFDYDCCRWHRRGLDGEQTKEWKRRLLNLGSGTLVFLPHSPCSLEDLECSRLAAYLDWFKEEVYPEFMERRCLAVLSLSVEVDSDRELSNVKKAELGLERDLLGKIEFCPLGEFGDLRLNDLDAVLRRTLPDIGDGDRAQRLLSQCGPRATFSFEQGTKHLGKVVDHYHGERKT